MLDVVQGMVNIQMSLSGKVNFQEILDLKQKDLKEAKEMIDKE